MGVTCSDTPASSTVKMRGRSSSIDTKLDGPTLAGGLHDLVDLGTMPLEPGFSTKLHIFSP